MRKRMPETARAMSAAHPGETRDVSVATCAAVHMGGGGGAVGGVGGEGGMDGGVGGEGGSEGGDTGGGRGGKITCAALTLRALALTPIPPATLAPTAPTLRLETSAVEASLSVPRCVKTSVAAVEEVRRAATGTGPCVAAMSELVRASVTSRACALVSCKRSALSASMEEATSKLTRPPTRIKRRRELLAMRTTQAAAWRSALAAHTDAVAVARYEVALDARRPRSRATVSRRSMVTLMPCAEPETLAVAKREAVSVLASSDATEEPLSARAAAWSRVTVRETWKAMGGKGGMDGGGELGEGGGGSRGGVAGGVGGQPSAQSIGHVGVKHTTGMLPHPASGAVTQ
jgi:hypothetical protein